MHACISGFSRSPAAALQLSVHSRCTPSPRRRSLPVPRGARLSALIPLRLPHRCSAPFHGPATPCKRLRPGVQEILPLGFRRSHRDRPRRRQPARRKSALSGPVAAGAAAGLRLRAAATGRPSAASCEQRPPVDLCPARVHTPPTSPPGPARPFRSRAFGRFVPLGLTGAWGFFVGGGAPLSLGLGPGGWPWRPAQSPSWHSLPVPLRSSLARACACAPATARAQAPTNEKRVHVCARDAIAATNADADADADANRGVSTASRRGKNRHGRVPRQEVGCRAVARLSWPWPWP